MPGGGHADLIYSAIYENTLTRERAISVFATSNGTYWCQNYTPSTDWTGDWYLC
jgi:hypothetical protein